MKDDIITDSKEMGYSVETAVYRHVFTYMKNIMEMLDIIEIIKPKKKLILSEIR